MDIDGLAHEVAAAFDGVPPPLDAIAPHDCDECWDLRDRLGGRPWRQLDAEARDAVRWELPLLSDEAKQHYLPVWLLGAIEEPRSDYSSALLFALDSDHRWEPSGGYSGAQRRAIAHVLELLIDHVEAGEASQLERALDRWSD